jgi:hypothetical protein
MVVACVGAQYARLLKAWKISRKAAEQYCLVLSASLILCTIR